MATASLMSKKILVKILHLVLLSSFHIFVIIENLSDHLASKETEIMFGVDRVPQDFQEDQGLE